jgi:hypothetical protein
MSREDAVVRFTEEILNLTSRADRSASVEAMKSGLELAAEQALQTLTKEQVIDILMFVVFDHELFFDIFEQAVSRSGTKQSSVD